MRENLTEIILCVDRSGSMRSIAVDMEGGLRQLVADQSAPPGECIVTYVTFDDHYEVEFVARPAAEVAADALRVRPRGSTALLDAMGRTIDDALARHAAMGEAKPGKVLLAVITDGQENASRTYTRDQVFARVAGRREAGWEVMFIGANQDAIAVGATLGIAAGSTVSYETTRSGVEGMSAKLSTRAMSYRSGS